jgi:DNA polymerase
VTRRPSTTLAARFLAQRAELGESEMVLDGLTRERALALARGVSAAAPEPALARGAGADRRSAAGRAPSRARAQAARAPRPSDALPAGTTPGPASLPVLPASYEELRQTALACTRCRLAGTRAHVVFSDGVPDARLVVVGEAPGANEDASGLPFVGAAGKFLDLLLCAVGLSREESVYICNVLKCRPPGNRNPLPDEIETCSPFLRKQIELIRPEALLAVGSFSGQLLTGKPGVSLGDMRGTVHSYGGIPLVCTYHPAALLRNPRWTRSFWDDLQLLRSVMDGA